MKARYKEDAIATFSLLAFIGILLMMFASNESEAATSTTCRSSAVKKQFDKMSGYSRSRKGYIVDHVCALSCGGIDSPFNMQYQTAIDSKKKDKWETTPLGCKKTCTPQNSTPTRQVFNCKGKYGK